jgi:hypothetical protein
MAQKGTTLKKKGILATIRETGGNVSKACQLAEISRRTIYNWKSEDAEFAAAWEEAVDFGTDELEEEARRRAFAGVDEPVFYQGSECGMIRKYSDTLLIFLLKGRKPETYRERVTIDVNKLDSDIERELAVIAARGQANTSGEVTSQPEYSH